MEQTEELESRSDDFEQLEAKEIRAAIMDQTDNRELEAECLERTDCIESRPNASKEPLPLSNETEVQERIEYTEYDSCLAKEPSDPKKSVKDERIESLK